MRIWGMKTSEAMGHFLRHVAMVRRLTLIARVRKGFSKFHRLHQVYVSLLTPELLGRMHAALHGLKILHADG